MLSKTKWLVLSLLCGLLACCTALDCQRGEPEQESTSSESFRKKWDHQRAELEYRLAQTELRLAKSDRLYMVLDLEHNKLLLKLKGAVVWDYPIGIAQPDSQDLQEFAAGPGNRHGGTSFRTSGRWMPWGCRRARGSPV